MLSFVLLVAFLTWAGHHVIGYTTPEPYVPRSREASEKFLEESACLIERYKNGDITVNAPAMSDIERHGYDPRKLEDVIEYYEQKECGYFDL